MLRRLLNFFVMKQTYYEVNKMTNMIVIAEISKGNIDPSTAELVTAAHALGGEPTLVVPCSDASIADSVQSTSFLMIFTHFSAIGVNIYKFKNLH